MLKKAMCIFCFGLFILLYDDVTQAEPIHIGFNQIENQIISNSPGYQINQLNYDKTLAERDESLKWSNPVIGYDIEDVDNIKESQFTIGKEFSMPWVHSKRSSSWKERIQAAEFFLDEKNKKHLSNLKTGYVSVKVHQQYLLRLEQLRAILTDASQIAQNRLTEGHLSGVEEHLIQMVVISLNSSYQEALAFQREQVSIWKAEMGYSSQDSIVLSTPIEFKEIPIEASAYYLSLIDKNPGIKAREYLRESLSKQASAEKSGIIPSIYLYGGMKKIDPDFDGYVAGVSLNFPLFNTNKAASKKYSIESNITAHETNLYKSHLSSKIKATVESIQESQGMLRPVASHFEEDLEALNNLLYSYEEGWMNLSELLNAIQIETGGLKDYYNQLTRYYQNLFELETISGVLLVTF